MASWRQRFQVEICKGSAKVSLVQRVEGNSTHKTLKRRENRYRRNQSFFSFFFVFWWRKHLYMP